MTGWYDATIDNENIKIRIFKKFGVYNIALDCTHPEAIENKYYKHYQFAVLKDNVTFDEVQRAVAEHFNTIFHH